MDWTFTSSERRADLISERCETQEWVWAGIKTTDSVLKHCFRGRVSSGVFYAVHERKAVYPDGNTNTHRWIEVTAMRRCDESGGEMSWCYKAMNAAMGPFLYNCPLSYIRLVPEPVCEPDCPRCADDTCFNRWDRDWRARVRAYWRGRAKQLKRVRQTKIGDVLQLAGVEIPSVKVTSLYPLEGEYGGKVYSIPYRMVVA